MHDSKWCKFKYEISVGEFEWCIILYMPLGKGYTQRSVWFIWLTTCYAKDDWLCFLCYTCHETFTQNIFNFEIVCMSKWDIAVNKIEKIIILYIWTNRNSLSFIHCNKSLNEKYGIY